MTKKEINLRPHQVTAIEELRNELRAKRIRPILKASCGFGKCLGINVPVLMYDGRVKMSQHIVPGDVLIGPDSKPRNVINTGAGEDRMYKVTPVKGEPYMVNSRHILSLRSGNARRITGPDVNGVKQKIERGDVCNVSISDYFSATKEFRWLMKGWRSAATFKRFGRQLVPPYILGIWLGDGNKNIPQIHCGDIEVIDAYRDYAKSLKLKFNLHFRGGCWCAGIVRCSAQDKNHASLALSNHNLVSSIGEFGKKHIPREYLTGSIDERLDLLGGLIDTDGHLSGGNYEITTVYPRLSDDILFLARSLGFGAYASDKTERIKSTGFEGLYHRIIISGDTDRIPVRVPRKKAKPRAINKNVLNVGIKVDPVGGGAYYGFEVDGDNLYLLGDFTVTHNTIVAADIVRTAVSRGVKVGFVVPRLTLVDQASAEFVAMGIDHGVIQGNHPLTNPHKMVQIISAQSLKERKVTDIGLFLVDECHVVYKNVANLMRSYSLIPFIGLTATPYTKGLGDLYTGIVEPITTMELIDSGYLHDPECYGPDTPDMGGVATVAGDFSQKQAGAKAHTEALVGNVVDNWLKHGGGRQTIVFASGVGHSQDIERRFIEAGVNAKHIDAYTDSEERRHHIAMFNAGIVTVLVSVGVMCMGFDAPAAEICVLARITKSLMLHIQQIGRISRIYTPLTKLLSTIDVSGGCVFITATQSQRDRIEAQLTAMLGDSPDIAVLTSAEAAGQDFSGVSTHYGVMPDKAGALVFDHSGNVERLGYFSDPGPDFLDTKDVATQDTPDIDREKDDKKREESLPRPCAKCFFLIPPGVFACPKCGFKPAQKSGTKETDDELVKLKKKKKDRFTMQQKLDFYSGLMYVVTEKGYKKGWASHAYKDKFGVWPQGVQHAPPKKNKEVDNYILHRRIKNARNQKKSKVPGSDADTGNNNTGEVK